MLLRNFGKVILVMAFHLIIVNCYSGSTKLSKRNAKSRPKRVVDLLGLVTDPQLNFYFEYNSCYALAVVVSLPLELPPGRSVFLSYNFETNYYYAYFSNTDGLVPVPFTHIIQPGSNAGTLNRVTIPPGYRQFGEGAELNNESTNKTEGISDEILTNNNPTEEGVTLASVQKKSAAAAKKKKRKIEEEEKIKSRKIRTILQNYFMSRRRFYKMMESKMDRSGLSGNDCLLKAICETAADGFGPHNGVIGSVVDVLFLPSASKDEKLPKKYYKAEANGKLQNCNMYNKMCPNGLFDFISKII